MWKPVPPSTPQYLPVPPSTSSAPSTSQWTEGSSSSGGRWYTEQLYGLTVPRSVVQSQVGPTAALSAPRVEVLCSPCGAMCVLPVWSCVYVCTPAEELCVYSRRGAVCVYSRRGAVCILPVRRCVCVLPPRSCVYTPCEEVCVCTPAEELCVFPAWLPFFPGPAKPYGGPKQILFLGFGAPPPTTAESSVL